MKLFLPAVLVLSDVLLSDAACTAPPDGTRSKCQTCFESKQCIDGYFCCPRMKLCVASSTMSCSNLPKRCSPRCGSYPASDIVSMCGDSCPLQGGYTTANAGLTWLEYANMDDSTPLRKVTCDEYVNAAGIVMTPEARESRTATIFGVAAGVAVGVVVAIGVAVGVGVLVYVKTHGAAAATASATVVGGAQC